MNDFLKMRSIFVFIAVMLMISCTTKTIIRDVVLPSYSLDTIIPKFGNEVVNPGVLLPLKEEIRLYAPFCNWKNDTIILEKEGDLPRGATTYYSQSPSRDLFCVSRVNRFGKQDTQMIFSSIYDYVVPVDSLLEIYRVSAREVIQAEMEFKHWHTDSIERRIKSLEKYDEQPITELKRIIIHNGKIVKVDSYRFGSFFNRFERKEYMH